MLTEYVGKVPKPNAEKMRNYLRGLEHTRLSWLTEAVSTDELRMPVWDTWPVLQMAHDLGVPLRLKNREVGSTYTFSDEVYVPMAAATTIDCYIAEHTVKVEPPKQTPLPQARTGLERAQRA